MGWKKRHSYCTHTEAHTTIVFPVCGERRHCYSDVRLCVLSDILSAADGCLPDVSIRPFCCLSIYPFSLRHAPNY